MPFRVSTSSGFRPQVGEIQQGRLVSAASRSLGGGPGSELLSGYVGAVVMQALDELGVLDALDG